MAKWKTSRKNETSTLFSQTPPGSRELIGRVARSYACPIVGHGIVVGGT